MPIDWDSPVAFDARLQRELADWLLHVKAKRNPARDNADTEADPVQFDEEDFDAFRAYASDTLKHEVTDDLLDTLGEAIGFSAWTSTL